MTNVIKDFSYNLWQNNSSVCERKATRKKKKKFLYFESVWNDVTWHSEISDCVLSPQAYLH
jgi:hypothetical protein